MGLKTFLGLNTKSAATGTTTGQLSGQVFTAAEAGQLLDKVGGMSPARLYATQPNVHVCVDFLGRNVAQLGVHVFERVSETDRQRNRDSNTAKVLARPNPGLTTYRLIRALVSDYVLYDEAWVLIAQTADGWTLRSLAVNAVSILDGDEELGTLRVRYSGGKGTTVIEQKNLIHLRGWSPYYGTSVSPAVTTLRDTLTLDIHQSIFRIAALKNGGQMGSIISRPADSGEWEKGGRTKFLEGLRAFRSDGASKGGTLLLEDGMTLSQGRFNAKEEQMLELTQLSLEVTARAFHIHPSQLGATGGLSYANVRELRTMTYTETLGPLLAEVVQELVMQLIPRVDPDRTDLYIEFNIKEKLSGTPAEEMAILLSATGRPIFTPNEARAKLNMSDLDGDADLLATPMNLILGDVGTAKMPPVKAGAPRIKASAPKPPMTGAADEASVTAVGTGLERFFKRQQASVLSKLSAKAAGDFWDAERWDRELSDDLFKLALLVTSQVSAGALDSVGFGPDEYNVAQTEAFLRAIADSRAAKVNATTLAAIEAALADPALDADGVATNTPEAAFEDARGSRGDVIAKTLVTTLVAFAVVEVAKQVAGDKATKTWSTNSAKPRADHAAMNGETVALNAPFSSGQQWPGDPAGGADGVANCACSVEINFPQS
ncbi:HK97 family phage portal protein [Cryobacterium sp. MP_3.1]|uniref:phage portal protein n=1 Tax=Cryobacterium sp. MP_3.1 TaxID=3071711 RepID=UPI002DF7BBA6|nr:HK97 family phage portal protein [Cryobacterium sp. MP_3.1]